MKLLKEFVRKTLAHRHLGKAMIGAVALNVARTMLKCPDLEWYVKFKTLFLISKDPALKIEIFKQKNQILREVNLAVEKVGYTTKIEELRT